jgi:crotonobetainyl-CoA:carnitine CoA-transferase CaiB-like acyl-CoA transferase
MGNAHPNLAPYAVFDCKDGWLILATGNDGQYQRLCNILGLEAMASDAKFLTNADRIANRAEMTARLTAATKDLGQGRPAGGLRGRGRARRADQRSGRGLRRSAGGGAGDADCAGGDEGRPQPDELFGAELALDRPAPRLGQHQDEVLKPEV